MTSLPHLPNETIRNIISFLHPQDIESFTSSCKLYHGLSKDVRGEHLRRKKHYCRVDDSDPMMILDLVSHPDLAWYVRRLTINKERHNHSDWRQLGGDVVHGSPFPADRIEEVSSIIRTGFRNSGFLSSSEETTWLEDIGKGIDAPLKVLLLVLAPNINTLVLSPSRSSIRIGAKTGFLHFLGKAVYTLAPISAAVRPRPFSALLEVQLPQHPRLRGARLRRVTQHEIAPFFMLPALESFSIRASMYLGRSWHPPEGCQREDRPLHPRASSIKHLHFETFRGSSFGDFVEIIEGIKALKSFRVRRPQPGHDFSEYLQTLSDSHAETLEELRFESDSFPATCVTTFVHFRALRRLALEVGSLHDILMAKERGSDNLRWQLETILPPSIERLEIRDCAVQQIQPSMVDLICALAEFVACKTTTHPEICTVYISSSGADLNTDPGFERLSAICKVHDVRLETWGPMPDPFRP